MLSYPVEITRRNRGEPMEAIAFAVTIAAIMAAAMGIKYLLCKASGRIARLVERLERTPEDETYIEKRKPISAGTDTGKNEA